MDSIVGMFWNCNEGDIVEETLTEAMKHVDSLFVADDNSTDNSWEIIQSVAKRHPDKIEYIRNSRDVSNDKGQRQALLTEIQKRYKPENTWVQIMESDIMILDTDIREAIKSRWCTHDLAVSWMALNACREVGAWDGHDTYPNWNHSIRKIMPLAHWMETMIYTFRPLPEIKYDLDRWRPWPQGWTNYIGEKPLEEKNRGLLSPLLAHYGYRGPTHFHQKFQDKRDENGFHRKYKSWNLTSPQTVRDTVSFFNGHWNADTFIMSRQGWIHWRKS
jgi:glycosyltransferase involved in cell wall biosynthesis